MRTRATLLILFAAALGAPLGGVIIDRVAVSVGTSVITVSQIDLAIRVTAFLNGEPPDFSPASRRQTAGRLLDQLLVRNELQLARYPSSPEDVAARLFERFRRDRFAGNDANYRAALARAGLTETEIKAQFLWQITFLRFVDARFRPGVQISDQEIQNYFDHTVVPAQEKAHPGQKISIDDYRDRIERVLIQQRVDQQLDGWLKEARSRAEVRFHEEAFR
ncbi:MAG TPA: hypothetical protein VFA33_29375 [Bryobacteraceae bacterium]|nr:hypothetical protein [Bryobacteraceae bacterium]